MLAFKKHLQKVDGHCTLCHCAHPAHQNLTVHTEDLPQNGRAFQTGRFKFQSKTLLTFQIMKDILVRTPPKEKASARKEV